MASTGSAASVRPALRVLTAASVRGWGPHPGWGGCRVPALGAAGVICVCGPQGTVVTAASRLSLSLSPPACVLPALAGGTPPGADPGWVGRWLPEADGDSEAASGPAERPHGAPQGPAGWGCSSRLGPAAQTVASLTLRPAPLPQTSTSASPRPVPTGPRVWTKSTATAAAAHLADPACGARRVGGGCRQQGYAWAGGVRGSLAFMVPHLSCPQ